MAYKRNQVEEAVGKVLAPREAAPSSELRTRVKRLLEIDRAMGRTPRSNDPTRLNYAFFSARAQGSGVEVWFSSYEAFALLNGLRLMAHGWAQSFAVTLMRRVRLDLEAEHARIIKQDPKILFDEQEIKRIARAGDFAVDNTDPVFLTIVTTSGNSNRHENHHLQCSVRRGVGPATKWAWDASGGAGGYTLFELTTSAHRLVHQLALTEPRRRGRS